MSVAMPVAVLRLVHVLMPGVHVKGSVILKDQLGPKCLCLYYLYIVSQFKLIQTANHN